VHPGEDPLAASLKTALDAKRTEASRRWQVFEEERKQALEEGVDLEQDHTRLRGLDDLHKEYEGSAEEVKELQERWERHVMGRAAEGKTGGRQPGGHRSGFPEGLGAEFLQRIGAGVAGLKALDATSGGTAVPSFFDPRIRDLPTRMLFIRSLIPVQPVTSDRVDYVRQSVFTNLAAPVAAGDTKPTSVISVERITTNVVTVAHVSEAIDRAILADFNSLVDLIDGQLRLGVLLAEENQILNGNGTPPNLRGILQTSGIGSQARGSDSRADAIHKAINVCRLSFFEPDAVVMHPTDYQTLRLEKTADGNYLSAPVVEADPDRIWGKQVITSSVIAQGTALVGAFGVGATLWDREQARVTFTEQGLADSAGEELYLKNQVRFRAEERIAFGVERPAAFTKVTSL
jgi:HK97 family phage major capsid protein